MIKTNDVVSLQYSVKTNDGVQLDASTEDEPLVAMLGSGLLIEGLEEAIIGRQAGDCFEVSIPADKAYGERLDGLVQSVPKSMFEGLEVAPGMSFRATTEEGEQSVIIIEVDDENVVVDGNHPLSGLELTFSVKIISVREPSEDERKNIK